MKETDSSSNFFQHFDPLDLAWASGLFEGEGSVSLVGNNNPRSRRLYMRLDMSSTDGDVLQRFCQVVGVGSVRGPYLTNGIGHKPYHKPYWTWSVTGTKALLLSGYGPFINQLGSRRRERIHEVKGMVEDQPPLRSNAAKTHCAEGHPYSEENTYRSKTGGRQCRICRRSRAHEYYIRRRDRIRDVDNPKP